MKPGGAVFEKLVGGDGAEHALPAAGSAVSLTDWSSDGRFVLATIDRDLWTLSDGKAGAVQKTDSGESDGQFSPDGRWIAYTSDESKRLEVYVQAFPASGAKSRISTAGGAQPRWRRDSKELFYLAADGRLMAVPINLANGFDAAAPTPLFQAPISDFPGAAGYAASSDGQRFLIRTVTNENRNASVTVVTNWPAVLKK